jgi:hypothetical protein
MKKHLYLFTLEVTPVTVGQTYNPLPSHLTLMSRFRSSLSPNELTEVAGPLFQRTKPIELIFGDTVQLGPKGLLVHLIERTEELEHLHSQLYKLLDTTGVTFVYPQFVGDGHKPHVSKREGDQFDSGYKQTANAAYLIEVEIKGEEHLRSIRTKFDFTS